MKKFWDSPAGVSAAIAGEGARATNARATDAVPTRSVPASVDIGGVRISPATVLAPMAGVTDTVFRRFIRNLGGCGLIMTEFTSADGVLRKKDQKAKRYLHFYEDEHPISAQLFGSDPRVMAEAARMVEGLGFDLVDLNLGCPAKKVVKCNGGSGLLRDLPAIGRIFEAVKSAVKIPFTVKFRAGWSDDEIVCAELARMAEACGLAAVALHARTREQGYSGNARWEWIAAVKDAVKIPVIGNGDIRSPEDACAMVTQTGCDAVMIGRTAPSNPWIFRQIEQYCAGTNRERHDLSRAENEAIGSKAFAAEGRVHEHVFRTSGAKAPNCFGSRDGTAEAVPFPSVIVAGDDANSLCRRADVSWPSATPDEGVRGYTSAGGYIQLDGQPGAAVPTWSRSYDQPSEADRYQMIRTYFEMLIEEELPDAVGKMKQFASWFTHGVPRGAGLRKAIYEAKSATEILSRVEEFFEGEPVAASNTIYT